MNAIIRRSPLLVALAALLFTGADWTRFRGPGANGVSEETDTPLNWGAEEHVLWKTPLHGFGASSPITLGEKIFLTCYSGYGLSEDEPGDQADLQHNLVCHDLADGKLVWGRGVKASLPRTEYRGYVALHGYASGTPTTDGKAVYAFFGRSGAVAFSLAGEPLWRTDVGSGIHEWGSGTSPILYGDLLIVNASIESRSLVALNKATGREAWRVPDIVESWSTPVIVEVPGGKQELVLSARGTILGLDPATGEQLWECAGIRDYVVPAVVAHEGIVYVTGGRRPQTVAIRAGGRGDVTETHLLWESRAASKVPSPLVYDGHLYWINQRGIAACVKADTGEAVYEERLAISGSGDKVYASLVYADGKLYGVTREDGTVVLAVGPELKELARNRLDDPSIFNATPVVTGGRLLLRSDRYLYCIGK